MVLCKAFTPLYNKCTLLKGLSRPRSVARCGCQTSRGAPYEAPSQRPAASSSTPAPGDHPPVHPQVTPTPLFPSPVSPPPYPSTAQAFHPGSPVTQAHPGHERRVLQISYSDSDGEEPAATSIVHYKSLSVFQIVSQRTRWLALFSCGLIGTAFVIESFEDIIEQHVQLSFFVPLVMGHGGNTGSQTVSSLIRALALKQVQWRDVVKVVAKEAMAGGLIGMLLGAGVLTLANFWEQISGEVGTVVAMSLPVVSLWSNAVAALITLAAHKAKLDPTMTAGPFMATVVDTSSLALYLVIARAFIKGMDELAILPGEDMAVGLLDAANELTSALPQTIG